MTKCVSLKFLICLAIISVCSGSSNSTTKTWYLVTDCDATHIKNSQFQNLVPAHRLRTAALSLKCSSRQTVKVRLATIIVARAFDTPLYRTCFCSMSCAQSLTLIFSDDGRFDYFRFAFVLADLRC